MVAPVSCSTSLLVARRVLTPQRREQFHTMSGSCRSRLCTTRTIYGHGHWCLPHRRHLRFGVIGHTLLCVCAFSACSVGSDGSLRRLSCSLQVLIATDC